jgi:hypothetical protein
MNSTCEVIGWLVDDSGARMIVREQDGTTSMEHVCSESIAIQTGKFRRSKPIIDRRTKRCIGYELEQLIDFSIWTK